MGIVLKLFDELKARGLIAQITHEAEVEKLLDTEKVTFYIGFDATADSLHVGHLLALTVANHMQKAGHTPILLVGGGTTKIGDPSGKQDMRKMLTDDDINHNIECFKKQFARLVDLNKAHVVNNADWIEKMTIPEFLRLGFNFTINDILRMDCYANRREVGLTLGEICYLPMQSLDFLHLYETLNCKMQLGGQDQWSNILGGVDLIRKTKGEKGTAFGLTLSLLTNSEGKKMGKTEKGAVWLDAEKTSPYEIFQYFRNVADSDVIKCIKLLTFIPLEQIQSMEGWQGAELNKAKETLAYEITKIVHGEEEAKKALESSKSIFSEGNSIDMPSTNVEIENEINILDLLVACNLAPTKSEAKRLVQQGGITVNDNKITDEKATFDKGELIIKKGKKVFHKAIIS